jgi:hypothetical protein
MFDVCCRQLQRAGTVCRRRRMPAVYGAACVSPGHGPCFVSIISAFACMQWPVSHSLPRRHARCECVGGAGGHVQRGGGGVVQRAGVPNVLQVMMWFIAIKIAVASVSCRSFNSRCFADAGLQLPLRGMEGRSSSKHHGRRGRYVQVVVVVRCNNRFTDCN